MATKGCCKTDYALWDHGKLVFTGTAEEIGREIGASRDTVYEICSSKHVRGYRYQITVSPDIRPEKIPPAKARPPVYWLWDLDGKIIDEGTPKQLGDKYRFIPSRCSNSRTRHESISGTWYATYKGKELVLEDMKPRRTDLPPKVHEIREEIDIEEKRRRKKARQEARSRSLIAARAKAENKSYGQLVAEADGYFPTVRRAPAGYTTMDERRANDRF